ncbi:hypothetical protein [Halobacillus seohaensis]|uniref:Uncharacterized protein n=1 Tax=Halobacillus seohaensis TaxID=447421 RepID=A0ABW2ES45_9BACI
MAITQYAPTQKRRRRPKTKRSNLYATTNPERMEMINKLSERNGGLSNLTYKQVYGED